MKYYFGYFAWLFLYVIMPSTKYNKPSAFLYIIIQIYFSTHNFTNVSFQTFIYIHSSNNINNIIV